MLHCQPVVIFGDGEQTRDFVNVGDVARANYQAGCSRGVSGAFNVASGTRVTINHLVELMAEASGARPTIEHGPPRKGDVRHSLADISAAGAALGFAPAVRLEAGLKQYMEWAKQAGV
jgi:nucleoside-diphosphate-sugar epimerase